MRITRKLHWKTLNNSFLFTFLSTISFCAKFLFHFHPPESIFHTFLLQWYLFLSLTLLAKNEVLGGEVVKEICFYFILFCFVTIGNWWKWCFLLRCFHHEMNWKDLKILLSEFLCNIFYHSQSFLVSSESFLKSIMKAFKFIIKPIWTTWNVSKYIL